MSRIPSKAMPHAYAHDNAETQNKGPADANEGGEGAVGGNGAASPTLAERAKKVGSSRVAQVAAGAVVAGAVAVAATKIVRARREAGEEEGGNEGGGKASKKKSKKD